MNPALPSSAFSLIAGNIPGSEAVPYKSPRELVSRDIVGLNGKHINYVGIPEIDFSVTLTNLETTPLLAVQKTIAEHKNAGLPGAGQYEIFERDHLHIGFLLGIMQAKARRLVNTEPTLAPQ